MALNLASENRLKDAGLITYYGKHSAVWVNTAQRTYAFVRAGFPTGTVVRPDDVVKELIPLVEINEDLRTYLKEKKLKQRLWITLFADLVIDRTWPTISNPPLPPPPTPGAKKP